ncbi:MAG: lipoprotein-releasing ABC transporter permease subunit [Mariprofundaceae bacterium]
MVIRSYEWMLARRYLRSRRDERFVSMIGWSSAIGVAIGVAALIIVLSVMYGFDAELKDKILGFSSHVDVQGPDSTLEEWPEWLKQVESLEGVERAAPYISAQVLANYHSQSTGAILKGVDPDREVSIARHVVSGNFLNSDSKASPFEVVIGKDLARKLGLKLGDSVRLISPTGGVGPSGMSPRMRAFRVIGIFDSGFYEYDVGMMVTSLAAVQRLNRLGDRVTGIELHLYDRNRAGEIAMDVRMALPAQAWVSDWTHRHRSFFKALKLERVVMGIILSLIVMVALFNMVSSLVMVVMERRKEIAILKTVGATHMSVMRIFVLMGCLLSGLGTLAGASFGLLLAWKLDPLLSFIETITGVTFLSGDVYYIDHVPSIIDPFSVTVVVVVSLMMGLIATLYPAWRAANVPPADSLRYE